MRSCADFAAELNASGYRRVVGRWCRAAIIAPIRQSSLRRCWFTAARFYPCWRRTSAAFPGSGCKLDLGRLQDAGQAPGATAGAMETRSRPRDRQPVRQARERNGEGIVARDLVERALDADIPVVIAVSSKKLRRLDQIRRLRHEPSNCAATAPRSMPGGTRSRPATAALPVVTSRRSVRFSSSALRFKPLSAAIFALAPLLRGEGWGEGPFPRMLGVR